VDLPLLPLERGGDLVVGGGEPLDGVAHLTRRGVARSPEGRPFEDGKPDLDLVEPRRVGRGEVEVDVPMTGQPAVVLGRQDPSAYAAPAPAATKTRPLPLRYTPTIRSRETVCENGMGMPTKLQGTR
jgi:hypothetical protein